MDGNIPSLMILSGKAMAQTKIRELDFMTIMSSADIGRLAAGNR